jgi:pyrimidine operon attenuation protein/uracil phosphoribosyltransferase
MEEGKIILDHQSLLLTLERLSWQIIETFQHFEDSCIIGLQPRGVLFADRLYSRLTALSGNPNIPYGKLDITFYRDDFRRRDKPIKANITEIDFLIEGKKVLLVDDVLYSGRTVQAALTALQHYGRPDKVELACLIDRRFNRHLPIEADFIGLRVDALDDTHVSVDWSSDGTDDKVWLFSKKVALKF